LDGERRCQIHAILSVRRKTVGKWELYTPDRKYIIWVGQRSHSEQCICYRAHQLPRPQNHQVVLPHRSVGQKSARQRQHIPKYPRNGQSMRSTLTHLLVFKGRVYERNFI
jgi:hypothetical protein